MLCDFAGIGQTREDGEQQGSDFAFEIEQDEDEIRKGAEELKNESEHIHTLPRSRSPERPHRLGYELERIHPDPPRTDRCLDAAEHDPIGCIRTRAEVLGETKNVTLFDRLLGGQTARIPLPPTCKI